MDGRAALAMTEGLPRCARSDGTRFVPGPIKRGHFLVLVYSR